MREVALHDARRDEEPGGDVLVGDSLSNESYDVKFGGVSESHPVDGRLRSPRPRWAYATASSIDNAFPSDHALSKSLWPIALRTAETAAL